MKFIIDFLRLGFLTNFLLGVSKVLQEFWKGVWNFLNPPSAYSWQTLILLSILSYLTASLATNGLQDVLASIGWVFLIFGVSWATTDNPPKVYGFSLAPWITGALVCVFVFGSWKGSLIPATLICWPPTSAALASVKEFFDPGLKPRIPSPVSRQNVVILLLANLLISCWFQFYFTTQDWLEKYPTLLADDFSKSAFVVKLETPQLASKGSIILNSLEYRIKQEFSNKPWSQVERLLLPNELESRMDALKQQVQKRLGWKDENLWWRFNYKVSSIKSGYQLQVQAIWQGPRSEKGDFMITKTCQITQTYTRVRGDLIPISKVNCQN